MNVAWWGPAIRAIFLFLSVYKLDNIQREKNYVTILFRNIKVNRNNKTPNKSGWSQGAELGMWFIVVLLKLCTQLS